MPGIHGFREPFRAIVERNVPVKMRDGATLYADVYRPDLAGKFPVLLTRTIYNKGGIDAPPIETYGPNLIDPVRAVSNGYVVVIQDCRGRYTSEGNFRPYFQEIDDGYDTVEWCASQPWSDGQVGMFGSSYVGATQLLAAISEAPQLKAIVCGYTASQYYEGWTYQGGAFELGFVLTWGLGWLGLGAYGNPETSKKITAEVKKKHQEALMYPGDSLQFLPLKKYPLLRTLAPYYYEWLEHPRYDDYWKETSIEQNYGKFKCAVLNLGGWYDFFLDGTIRNFTGVREKSNNEDVRKRQSLLIGPWLHSSTYNVDWNHTKAGEIDFNLNAFLDSDTLHLRWFDYWLKGVKNGVEKEKPVKLFVMGANEWREADEYPLPGTKLTKYYLHSGGKANSSKGDGELSTSPQGNEPMDSYVYDPENPVPTIGGALCCILNALPPGAFDQRKVEGRKDVLVYSTPPLRWAVEVTGPIKLNLWASTDAKDTDFTGKLVDVYPDGRAINLTDGIIRARYREGTDKARFIERGNVYEYAVDLWHTSNLFMPGHRIRLEVSSSNFPRFDRNPNSGDEVGEEKTLVKARQKIYHNRKCPSHLILPILVSQLGYAGKAHTSSRLKEAR